MPLRADGGALRPFAIFFLAYFGFMGLFSPYLALYLADLKFSPFEIGVLISMLQVLRIFGPNLWGWIADHAASRARVVRLLAVHAFVSFLALFFVRGFAATCAALVLINLFLSGMAPICEALTVQKIGHDFPRYGRIRLWGSIGFIAAVTAGGAVLDAIGVQAMPAVSLALLAFVLLAAFRVGDVAPVHAAEAAPSVRALLRRADVLAFFASCFLMVAAHAALYAYLSLYLEILGYSKTAIGMLWALGVVAEIAFFYFQARCMRDMAIIVLIGGSFAVAALRFVVIGTLANSLGWLLFAQLLHAVTFGVHHAASLSMLRRWFCGPLAARGQALYTSISYGLGGTVGGLAAASVWARIGPAAVFVASAAIALLGGVAVFWMWRIEIASGAAHAEVLS